MANVFKEAKKLQRQHPRLDWQSAIKKASQQMRGKKKTTVKKSAPTKRASRVSPDKTSDATVSQLKSQLRRAYEEKENKLVLQRYRATKKADKRKLSKQLTELRAGLRKLGK